MPNLTDQFVDTLHHKATAPMPAEVEQEARKCLLDELGSILAGSVLLRDKVTAYLDLLPKCEGATVINLNRRASLPDAALINGVCGHVFDIDDGHRFSTVHLGATIIPAVLAAAEHEKLPIARVLRGIVVGYEAAVRIGCCIQPSHRNRGFHSSGTGGTVGAAMGVAAALGFDWQMTKEALSAALTNAGGINEMMENVSGMKPFNIGRAACAGLTSAFFVRAGFNGPLDPLEGKFGFLKGFTDAYRPEVLTLQHDERWSIMGAYHKPYAACRHAHSAIDAALAVRPAISNLADVQAITVRMYKQGVNGHAHTDIPSLVAAKMSTPYCVGLALKTGKAGISGFTEANRQDEDIMRICRLTTVTPDEALSKLVPDKRSAIIEVRMNDGTLHTHHTVYALGEPEAPMSAEMFRSKFMELAAFGGKTPGQASRIADGVLNGSDSFQKLLTLLY